MGGEDVMVGELWIGSQRRNWIGWYYIGRVNSEWNLGCIVISTMPCFVLDDSVYAFGE